MFKDQVNGSFVFCLKQTNYLFFNRHLRGNMPDLGGQGLWFRCIQQVKAAIVLTLGPGVKR